MTAAGAEKSQNQKAPGGTRILPLPRHKDFKEKVKAPSTPAQGELTLTYTAETVIIKASNSVNRNNKSHSFLGSMKDAHSHSQALINSAVLLTSRDFLIKKDLPEL